jgi:hypothetical protein
MKTTVDLPEELVYQAKQVALSRKITLRTLVLRGLQQEILNPTPEVISPLRTLLSLNTTLWEQTNPDFYVEELRKDWV